MKKAIKKIKFVIVLALTIVGGLAGSWAWKYYQLPLLPDNTDYKTLAERASKAEKLAKQMRLSEKYCFLVDYSIPSGTPRLYVWSFDEKRVVAKTYVMHGPGGGSTNEKPVFSNKLGSNCSSLGRFAVTHEHGKRNKSGYYIRGLDFNNQTARSRALMIHRAAWVDMNCWRTYIPLNSKCCLGCLTISSRGLDYIAQIMNSESKDVLLWNFY